MAKPSNHPCFHPSVQIPIADDTTEAAIKICKILSPNYPQINSQIVVGSFTIG